MPTVMGMDSTPGLTPHWSPALVRQAAEGVDLAAGAAAYANSGIPVFPCARHGKQPLTRRGFQDASTDPVRVTHWWQRWPEANIGIPTGVASGVDVLDVDVHAGGTGYGAFERARGAGFATKWAWLVRTPSGGLHVYFLRSPEVSEQRSWQVPGQHVDFRGDGGYIIAPPSRVRSAGGEVRGYDVIMVAQHRPEPVDAVGLRKFLDPPRLYVVPDSAPERSAGPEHLASWLATRPEGGRNRALFWATCRMVEGGHRLDAALSLLGPAARTAGLSDQETERTICSSYRIATRLGPVPESRGPSRPFGAEGVQL
jgi:hypothetical protein